MFFPHLLLRSGSSRCLHIPVCLAPFPCRFRLDTFVPPHIVHREKWLPLHKSIKHFSPIARCITVLIPPCFAHGWFNPSQVYASTRFLLLLCSPCGSCLRLVLPSQAHTYSFAIRNGSTALCVHHSRWSFYCPPQTVALARNVQSYLLPVPFRRALCYSVDRCATPAMLLLAEGSFNKLKLKSLLYLK